MILYFSKENWFSHPESDEGFRLGKLILHILLFFFVGIPLLWGTWGTVGAGERGVLLQFSAVKGVKAEGLYFKLPYVQKVKIMDVKVQKEQTEADAASKDLQTVKSTIALNFHLDPEAVGRIYQSIGQDYKVRVIDPAIQESVKAGTAKYTAEELITKRELVREEIRNLLTAKLTTNGIRVDEFNIVNFDFSSQFNQAIEAKVTAEQNALAAKNKLEQIKYEAEQRVTTAEAEAKAIQIQAQAIQQQGGTAYVNLKAVEKWDGKLPVYMLGDSTPLINLNK